jgi:Transposase IS200 like
LYLLGIKLPPLHDVGHDVQKDHSQRQAHTAGLVSPSGMVETPRLQAKQGFGVTWSRATLPTGSAHEERPEGASSVGAEVSESGFEWGGRDSGARPAAPKSPWSMNWRSFLAKSHVTMFSSSYRPNQPVSQIMQWLKGISSRVLLQEFPQLRKKFWGKHVWARGYLAVSSGTIPDEMIREYIDEQEGEQIADDSRFPIDNP